MDLEDLVSDRTKRPIVRKRMGEEIPFEDQSFDVVVSFNALDHSADATKVVQEIYRVLRLEGEFLLWIYVLRKSTLLQGFLNRIDSPHPQHFTRDQLMTMIWENYF
jgi:ubiquinone/menaquinone biosynthesis C-methylase UbiE